MFRARTLCGLGLALLIVVVLVWRPLPTEAGPPDDGKERTTAECLVGTWIEVSTDGCPRSWWNRYQFVYRADGTYRTSSSVPIRELWLHSREGRYVVTGKVVRHHYELTSDDEAQNRLKTPEFHRPGWWDNEVVSVSHDELVVLSPSGSSRLRLVYRRIN